MKNLSTSYLNKGTAKILLIIFTFVFLATSPDLQAQVSINDDESLPDPSSMLDVKSSAKVSFRHECQLSNVMVLTIRLKG